MFLFSIKLKNQIKITNTHIFNKNQNNFFYNLFIIMPNEIESYNKKLYFHAFKTKETKKEQNYVRV